MDKKEFLLEIGTEDIPAAALNAAKDDLNRIVRESFDKNRLDYGSIEVYGTPRRIVLYVKSMSEAQDDIMIEKRGPAKSAAYDKNGNPTKAALGFARGQGVDISDVSVINTDKGEYIAAVKKEAGRKTIEVLSEILPQIVMGIPFRKSMRWSDGSVRFVRPIHWILALFDEQVVNFSIGGFSKGSLKSSNLSCGHRFLSPSRFKVTDFKQYKEDMNKRFVVFEGDKRKKTINNEIAKKEKSLGVDLVKDDELLEHVINLVEYPVVVAGSFDEKFLKLPKEVLINAMKVHQKYFAVTKKGKSKLTNSFINVINMKLKAKDEKVVIEGNERVLRARLSDAEFFYNEDKKKSLDSYNERLKGVIFQNKLGTMYEKVERIKENAKFIAETLAPKEAEKAVRAAQLCKADLVTEMVCEFPKLQGVMGCEYARLSGEDKAVAEAVKEHYLPVSVDGSAPETAAGTIVSIADKIDTITACFSVGLIPTGAADPFALRRQTLGIINMLYKWRDDWAGRLSLRQLVKKAYDNIKDKAERAEAETVDDVLNFFTLRLKNLLTPKQFSYDVVDAVLAQGLDNVIESRDKISALSEFKKRPDFEALAISFKRVGNIVKGIKEELSVKPSLFNHDSEKALYNEYDKVKDDVSRHCKKGGYLKALEIITKLKKPVDKFFDDVLVMVEDEALRNNRLALLQSIQKVFLNIADFKRVSADNKHNA
jgi:glycyl-tRNA synthetase beta chain